MCQWRRLLRSSSRVPRGITALLSLLGYLAIVIGFPVPISPRDKITGLPAGCGGHGCGCAESMQARGNCCCQPKASCCSSERGAVTWVVGISARGCRGEETVWLTLQGSAPPPAAVSWSTDAPLVDRLPFTSVVCSMIPSTPPTPPPRG